MATLTENAAAVKSAAQAIDAAIVAKGGTTTGGLTNAAAAIAALPSGDTRFSELIEGTLTEIDDSTITKVGVSAFENNKVLTSVSLNVATVVNSRGFWNASNITKLELMSVLTLVQNCCYGMENLKDVHLESVTNFGPAFNGVNTSSGSNYKLTDIWCGEKTATEIMGIREFPGMINLNAIYPNITFHGAEIAGTGTRHCVKYIEGAWVATTEPIAAEV